MKTAKTAGESDERPRRTTRFNGSNPYAGFNI